MELKNTFKLRLEGVSLSLQTSHITVASIGERQLQLS